MTVEWDDEELTIKCVDEPVIQLGEETILLDPVTQELYTVPVKPIRKGRIMWLRIWTFIKALFTRSKLNDKAIERMRKEIREEIK